MVAIRYTAKAFVHDVMTQVDGRSLRMDFESLYVDPSIKFVVSSIWIAYHSFDCAIGTKRGGKCQK